MVIQGIYTDLCDGITERGQVIGEFVSEVDNAPHIIKVKGIIPDLFATERVLPDIIFNDGNQAVSQSLHIVIFRKINDHQFFCQGLLIEAAVNPDGKITVVRELNLPHFHKGREGMVEDG